VITGLDICDEFGLNEEELAEEWVAFSASHLGWHNKLDEDILARMVAEMEKEKNKASIKTASAKPKPASKPNLYPFFLRIFTFYLDFFVNLDGKFRRVLYEIIDASFVVWVFSLFVK
jgi:hypothetical protein